MSFLDGLLGKGGIAGGADTLGGVQDLIESQGGVQVLTQKLGAGGLGDMAASWIGKGGNLPISAEQIEGVMGSGPIGDFAKRLGVSPQQAAGVIAMALPMVIDKLTPDGDAANAKSGVDAGDLLGGLLGGGGGGLGGLLGGLLKK
ncbi:YidB family protein [Brevundimonas sp.]|uniref:YidB family protein n=1 Tax=Brevundimonas sp. TaxID=1871086 RepID=UPI00289BFD9A|nr:YidB family protein [Brevundimonas sp.]